ncbi:jg5982 [Pararge aegeria aegeria]|uniref:Jg5982 protein n=1 Tax=Pararge aegeria aegeria TaxID=348720 RepID=A0A8S4S465_9NEOP|nr:jg5982 [Pararge aegeria aegeria]
MQIRNTVESRISFLSSGDSVMGKLKVDALSNFRSEGGKAVCNHCDKKFISGRGIRDHLQTHNNDCPYCELHFRHALTHTQFSLHKLQVHNVDDRLCCDACDAKFNSKRAFARHKDAFHMLGKKYFCQKCDYETYNANSLYRHRFMHKTEKNFHCDCNRKQLRIIQPSNCRREGDKLICNHCDKIYKSRQGVRNHLRTNHIYRYDCPHCELHFADTSPLIIHKLEVHNVDDRIRCDACDGKFNSRRAFDNHKLVFHMLGKKYFCNLCPYETYNKDCLSRHRVKHKTIKNYHCDCSKKKSGLVQPGDFKRDGDKIVCTRCDKTYKTMEGLRNHVITIHNRPYVCPYCDLRFGDTPPLIIHKLEAHDIDDRISCNACDGKFNSQRAVTKHIKVYHMMGKKLFCELCEYETYNRHCLSRHSFKHKTIKDYHCRFCKKSFLRRRNLVLHEKIHMNERTKVCQICKQAFVQKASLNYHMMRHHPEANF